MSVDQQTIDRASATDLVALVLSRGVELKKQGAEFVGLCPFHAEKTPSFSVNQDKGRYHCFGCGAGGDPIEFLREHAGLGFQEAVRELAGGSAGSGVAVASCASAPAQPVDKWEIVAPVPSDAPKPPVELSGLSASARWAYLDDSGRLLFYVCRFEKSGGKDIRPLSYWRNRETGELCWRWKSMPSPRPLFGLDLLAAHPEAQVLIVEGEKSADAAARLIAAKSASVIKAIAVTWPGGANSLSSVNLAPLRGRKIVIWPDADEPGAKAADELCRRLGPIAAQIKRLDPPAGVIAGWDAADAEADSEFDFSAFAKTAYLVEPELVQTGPTSAVEVPAKSFEVSGATSAAPTSKDAAGTAVARPLKSESKHNFGVPVDLFNVMLPPELPLDALPSNIGNYSRDQAVRIGCDPAIVAISALVAAASMIHDDFKIQPKRHDTEWRESARLWAAVVGDPSTQKSPGMAAGVRHVKSADVECGLENKAAEAAYLEQREKWKEACKRDGKGIHPEPKPPLRKRRMVGDVTVEALSDVLADNPAGLLCFKDELSGWFGSMDAYKGGGKGGGMDRAHWLESHNGGPRTVDRVTRGSIMVPNFSVCMLGGIQPAPMKRIASSIDHDGLLQRFIVLVARPRTKGEDRAPDAGAKEAFGALFEYLGKLQPSSKPVLLSEAAQAVRERVDETARAMGAAFDHDHMQAWLGKWMGLFARLLLTMHVCECAERGLYPTAEAVSGELAGRVEKLLCGILLHHAIYFYTEMVDANQHHEHVRQLARLIVARGWTEVTRRDLAQNWKASRTLDDRELNAVMGALCNFDWLSPVEGAITHDGKPKAWAVNPQVHEAFAACAEAERERRAAAVNALRELRSSHAANDTEPRAA